MNTTVKRGHWKLLTLPTHRDARGDLAVLEHLPFTIQRAFSLTNVPVGFTRANHAHPSQEQVIVALAGSFEVQVDNGKTRETHQLIDLNAALYIEPNVWVSLAHFSKGAICLVLSSEPYDPRDYFTDYDAFRRQVA